MWWLQRRTANTPGISSATTGGALSRSSCATVTRTAESQITATRPTAPVSNTRISLHYTVSTTESVVKLIALHILVRDGIKAVLSRQRQRSRQRGRGRGEQGSNVLNRGEAEAAMSLTEARQRQRVRGRGGAD